MRYHLLKKLKRFLYPVAKIFRLVVRFFLNCFFNNAVPIRKYEFSNNHIIDYSYAEKNISLMKNNNLFFILKKDIYEDHFSIILNSYNNYSIYYYDNILLDSDFQVPVYNNKLLVDGYYSTCNEYLNIISVDNNEFYINKQRNYPDKRFNKFITTTKGYFFNKKKVFLTNYVIVTSFGSENYFHWFFETLAKLFYLKNSYLNIKNIIIKANKPFQIKTLEFFNEYNFYFQGEEELLDIHRSFIISLPDCAGFPSKELLDFYMNKFQKINKKRNLTKKILVLRKKSSGRHFINERFIINLLKPLGFNAVYLEDMSFENQVSLFKSAEIIIAAHGAGLTNLIFSDKKTLIIEYFNYKYVNTCFSQITKIKQMKHYVIIDQVDYGHDKDNGIYVNLSDLKAILI